MRVTRTHPTTRHPATEHSFRVGEDAAPLDRDFFAREALLVAPDLIGTHFTVNGVGGIIVETEAYDETDPASHSYLGRRSSRNAAMYGPPGDVYVYRSYGIHWCLNFVCGDEGSGSAVLIRAIEPVWGLAAMRRRRGVHDAHLLCNGPGRLCQALRVVGTMNGCSLFDAPFAIARPKGKLDLLCGPRIGITRGEKHCWRFGLKGSKALSRPFAPLKLRN